MDKQTGKFIARIAENLPDMESDLMQNWIDRPKKLQEFLRGLCPSVSEPARSWREENGVIYFSVVSDGTTGEDWITRLESKGFRIGDYAKRVLRSPDFQPAKGITTQVAVLKGTLFTDNDRITKNIRDRAYAGTFTQGRKLSDPNPEVACLIRENFSDEDLKVMGFWWLVAMHEPIKDSDGDPGLLDAYRNDDGCWLGAYCGSPGGRWSRLSGFAFAVSQV